MNVIKFIQENGLFKDTIIMMIAMTLANFFNYLYQLIMGRLLTPQEYGELFSLLSLFYIFSVFSNTVNASITKFVTAYSTRREYGKIKAILIKGTKVLGGLGLSIYLVIIVISPLLSKFLRIEAHVPLLVLFASLPLAIVLPMYQGVLRGTQRFVALGSSLSLWAFFKMLFGVALVLWGYGVLGGVFGVFIAHVGSLLFTLFLLRGIFRVRGEGRIDVGDFLKYSWMAFLVMLAYNVMWNIDVILVKHYMSSVEAGEYSAISVLGKIALFAPAAVGIVVFPKTAEKHEMGEEHFHILLRGIVFAVLISGGVVLLYAFFPEFIITLVYGGKYINIAPYLWEYGLAMTFLALTGVVMNYALSVNKTEIFYPMLITVIGEIIAVYYLKQSIGNIVTGILIAMLVGWILVMVVLLKNLNERRILG